MINGQFYVFYHTFLNWGKKSTNQVIRQVRAPAYWPPLRQGRAFCSLPRRPRRRRGLADVSALWTQRSPEQRPGDASRVRGKMLQKDKCGRMLFLYDHTPATARPPARQFAQKDLGSLRGVSRTLGREEVWVEAVSRGQGSAGTDHTGLEDDSEVCGPDSQEAEKPPEVLSGGVACSGRPFTFVLGTLVKGSQDSELPSGELCPARSLRFTWPRYLEPTSTQGSPGPQNPTSPTSPLASTSGPAGHSLRALRDSDQFAPLRGKLLTAAVGSLCVQATGSRSFQSVSPSSWSVRRKQDPVEGR